MDIGVVDPKVSTAWPDPTTSPSPYTIDTMTMKTWYTDAFSVANGMPIATQGETYTLSDHSTWPSGAGSASWGLMSPSRVVRAGAVIRYYMDVAALFVERTDYDSGNHSAHYRLETLGAWTIVAAYGSKSGTLEATALITDDSPANYVDARFNYLSRALCSAVPVRIAYTLPSAVFDEHLFEHDFDYTAEVVVQLKPQ